MPAALLLVLLAAPASAAGPSREEAARFAALALRCADTELPNKPDHVISASTDMARPREAHPAFYGCFDWHSSVHGHWLMVRALKLYPDLPDAPRMRALLDAHLSTAAIAGELEYLRRPAQRTFERSYGWAWLLKLSEELDGWDDPQAERWAAAVDPLARELAARYKAYFPKLDYPLRIGTHQNTAFALAFGLDWAREKGDRELESLLLARSRDYFEADKDYPAAWEPGGQDFFSPALIEADLMRRALGARDFARWLDRFLPELGRGGPKSLTTPATVSDRSDGFIVHLDGLNLSRAWCLRGVAAGLPQDDPRRPILLELARRHLDASLPHVASGDYMGEHWLATFAM